MNNYYSIAVEAENALTVVMRIVGLFQRRRLLFDNLEVQTGDELKLWLTVQCDDATIEKLHKQILRMSDVSKVSVKHSSSEYYSSYTSAGDRPELVALA